MAVVRLRRPITTAQVGFRNTIVGHAPNRWSGELRTSSGTSRSGLRPHFLTLLLDFLGRARHGFFRFLSLVSAVGDGSTGSSVAGPCDSLVVLSLREPATASYGSMATQLPMALSLSAAVAFCSKSLMRGPRLSIVA